MITARMLIGVGLLVASGACQLETSPQARKDLDMADLCQLPEDEVVFREYVLERVGGEITAEAVTLLQGGTLLQKGFELVGDKMRSSLADAVESMIRAADIPITDKKRVVEYFSDPSKSETGDKLASETRRKELVGMIEKVSVQAIELRKRCAAADGVDYDLTIFATLDQTGRATFSQFLVEYSYEAILAGRRPFSFKRFRGSDEEQAALLTAATTGFTLFQLDRYMAELGGMRSAAPYDVENFPAVYYYEVDLWADITSRGTGYDMSKEIRVKDKADGTVQSVTIITGTARASAHSYDQLNLDRPAHHSAQGPERPPEEQSIGSKIYVESRRAVKLLPASFGLLNLFSHLYLVYENDKGEEFVIRGGPKGNKLDLVINKPLEDSPDARGHETPADRGQVELNHSRIVRALRCDMGRLWAEMEKTAQQIRVQARDYGVLHTNANAVNYTIQAEASLPKDGFC